MKPLACVLAVFLVLAGGLVGTADAQTQTGTVTGKIVDQQGAVLPGVTLTLTGPRGSMTAVTDPTGNYRFVGLIPSTYVLKAELSGFLPQQEDKVVVSMGKTITVDFSMKVGGLTETVEVVGQASTVDVRSSATTTSVSGELLSSMAIYDSTSSDLMNNAPGINDTSAYGGQSSYGNALLLDGVDTRDPEGGSAWTFFNQNLIEEIQIGGLGAPAEYGGFSGGIVNTITKSGGNLFSGLFSLRYTNDKMAGENVTDAVLAENGSLGAGDVTKKLVDYSVQLGGPFKKDKAFFYASIQRYSSNTDPSGPLNKRVEISPRFNLKTTFQPTRSDTLIFGVQYDQYNVDGRVGWWPSNQATYNATVTEDAPEWVWNAQWRRVFGSSTLLEAKFTGYTGYYYLDPVDPAPPIHDGMTDEYSGGGGGLYYADRSRNQVNVALTHYAQAFGRHSFKFGVEVERGHVRSQYQPYGPQGFYIYTQYGVPYAQYRYGYDVQGDNHRTSAFAQDQWNIGRLTANIGLRLDHIRGYSPVMKKTVYTPDSAWGPRLGLAYDITGKGTTVIKGFWGRYFEGPATGFFTSATPGISDYSAAYYDAEGNLGPWEVLTPGTVYGISSKIKHPRTDEANVAFEQQITPGLRVTATGIYRKVGNFINNVVDGARWSPVEGSTDLFGPYTAYYWDNQEETAGNFLIRNIKGYQYIDTNGNVIATINPKRDYKALMLLLSRDLRNRWGFQLSYVLSKAEGNVDNSGFGSWLGGNAWINPTTVVNNDGELTNSRRHEIKAFMSYHVPVIDTMLGVTYTGVSGTPYTPYAQLSNGELNTPVSSRRQIFLKPRGSERNDFYHNVDIRAEKVFRAAQHRFGVYVDVTNLFNRAGVTGRQTRVPDTTIGGNTVLYGAPTVLQSARQATIGLRWTF